MTMSPEENIRECDTCHTRWFIYFPVLRCQNQAIKKKEKIINTAMVIPWKAKGEYSTTSFSYMYAYGDAIDGEMETSKNTPMTKTMTEKITAILKG